MKKIYLSLAALALCGAVFGQAGAQEVRKFPGLPSEVRLNGTSAPQHSADRDVNSQKFDGWFDPVADPAFNRGLAFSGAKKAITYYTNTLFVDSTAVVSDSSGVYPTDLYSLGNILDPTSSYLYTLPNNVPSYGKGGPVVTVNDSYNLDSVSVDAWYIKKKKNVVDTLYVWITWDKPTNNSTFYKTKTSKLWIDPIATWRDSIFSVRMDTLAFPRVNGPVIKPTAPVANRYLCKYALQDKDTVVGTSLKRIEIKLDQVLTIPAGNVTACFLEYRAQAGSIAAGDCIWQYDNKPKKPQNANGFAVRWWSQIPVDSLKDLKDYLVDFTSKASGGLTFPMWERYTGSAQKVFFIRGDYTSSPGINYHIYGTSTVGIKEVNNNNFSLEQNSPNPFNNETTISYQLKTSAKNVSVVVYNVAGVKMFENNQVNTAAGKYSVKINNTNLAAGVYFYSLVVDGHQATKRMVVTE